MDVNQYIDKVYETKDLGELNDMLANNCILIGTYIERIPDETVFERLWYSVGHVNMSREFPK